MKGLLLKFLSFYRRNISPYTPPCCRFYPTCSAYSQEAITRYGAWTGGKLALKRLLRCHPFSKRERFDPVPTLQKRGTIKEENQ